LFFEIIVMSLFIIVSLFDGFVKDTHNVRVWPLRENQLV